jgi:NADPH:quinone reductase-like Zn-dependent oxidoreductase
VVVDVEWSGISTGTERLLWSGRMPPFPGMGYPLVPGYESVGRIAMAGEHSGARVGERVFVPGARCFGEIRGLFGGAAAFLEAEELGGRLLLHARTVRFPHPGGGEMEVTAQLPPHLRATFRFFGFSEKLGRDGLDDQPDPARPAPPRRSAARPPVPRSRRG